MCTHTQLCICMVEPCARKLDDRYVSFSTNLKNHIAEDKNFHTTWFYFIGNPHHINIIINFRKIYFKTQKSPHLHKMMPKPTVQNSWQYYLIKAHGSSSWHIISFLTRDPSSWVSSWEFWESWFGGSRSMFNKAPTVQSW